MSAPRPPVTGLRAAVERRSAAPLAFLASRPRWLPLLLVLGLLAGTAALPRAAAAVCLAVLLALVGWLTYLAWPVLTPGGRAARLGVLAMVLALVATRLP